MRLNTLHQRGIKTALVLLIFVIITSFTLAQINNITGAAILIEQKEYTKCLTEKKIHTNTSHLKIMTWSDNA